MRRREWLKRLQSGVAAVLIAVLAMCSALVVPSSARANTIENAITETSSDPYAEEVEGSLTFEGTTYWYQHFYEDDLRAIKLTNTADGTSHVYAYDPLTMTFFVDGHQMDSLIAESVDTLIEDQSRTEKSDGWSNPPLSYIPISFSSTASVLDICLQVALAIGHGTASSILGLVGTNVINQVKKAGSAVVSFTIQIQTVGLYQNQRVKFYIRPNQGQLYGPYYIYIPPAS